jgi:hypothetical protein
MKADIYEQSDRLLQLKCSPFISQQLVLQDCPRFDAAHMGKYDLCHDQSTTAHQPKKLDRRECRQIQTAGEQPVSLRWAGFFCDGH